MVSKETLMRGTLEYVRSRTKNRKPKTASKIREDEHAVEVVETHIFRREAGKTPNSNSENLIYFYRKPETENQIEQKPQTATDTKPKKP